MLQDFRTLNSSNHTLSDLDRQHIRDRVFHYANYFYRSALQHEDYLKSKSDLVLSIIFTEYVINDAFMYQLSESNITNISITGLKGFLNRYKLVHSDQLNKDVCLVIKTINRFHPHYVEDIFETISHTIKLFSEIMMQPILAFHCCQCSKQYLKRIESHVA